MTDRPSATADQPVAAIERRIATLLSVGVAGAVGLMALGVVLLLTSGRSPLEVPWPGLEPATLVSDILALRPEGLLWAGLLVTLATPVLRIVASIIGFVATGERRMALLGIAVLAVLALAVAVSVAAEG